MRRRDVLLGAGTLLAACHGSTRGNNVPSNGARVQRLCAFEGQLGRTWLVEREGCIAFQTLEPDTRQVVVVDPRTASQRSFDGGLRITADGRPTLVRGRHAWSLPRGSEAPQQLYRLGRPSSRGLVAGNELLTSTPTGLASFDRQWARRDVFRGETVPAFSEDRPTWRPPNPAIRGARLRLEVARVGPDGALLIVDRAGGLARADPAEPFARLFDADVKSWTTDPSGEHILYTQPHEPHTTYLHTLSTAATKSLPNTDLLNAGFSGSWVVLPSNRIRGPAETLLVDLANDKHVRLDTWSTLVGTRADGRLLLASTGGTLCFDGREAVALDFPCAADSPNLLGLAYDEAFGHGTLLRLEPDDSTTVVAEKVSLLYMHTPDGYTVFTETSASEPTGFGGPLIVVHPSGHRERLSPAASWYQLASHPQDDTRWLYYAEQNNTRSQTLCRVRL